MKGFRIIALMGVTMLLALVASLVVAQDKPQPQETGATADQVSYAIHYQGQLLEPGSGTPLTGTFDLEFSFWSSDAGGTKLWPETLRAGQVIEGGLYRTELPVDQDVVSGQELWLQIRVRETGPGTIPWETLTPRIEILSTVYALTLRPGARMEGALFWPDSLLTAVNTARGYGLHGESQDQGGFGILGYNGSSSTFATGGGVRGSVLATGYGVVGTSQSGHGVGVSGYTEDGYGVYGSDTGSEQGRGYAGYFISTSGVGVYGQSNGTRVFNNLYTPGVYGRSANGVGVYGRSDGSDDWTGIGVLGWGDAGPGGQFVSHSATNIIEAIQDVNGDGVTLSTRFRVELDGSVHADGNFTSPAADLAEMLPVEEGPEPGDVLIIGPDGKLARSSQAYQVSVVGIYSTKPAFVGNGAHQDKDGYAPLAVVGLVPVKASAENGPIVPGDLLVSSATPGHCMAAGSNPRVGTVLGKALEGLEEGTGVIQMLVTLQ